jgi:hypothetical protein
VIVNGVDEAGAGLFAGATVTEAALFGDENEIVGLNRAGSVNTALVAPAGMLATADPPSPGVITAGGGVLKVNTPVPVTDPESGFVITTFAVPAVPIGAVAVIEVDELNVTPVALVPPIRTVAPETKPVPVIVTVVPPSVDPLVGVIEINVGVDVKTYVNALLLLVTVPESSLVIVTLVPPTLPAGVVAEIDVAEFT